MKRLLLTLLIPVCAFAADPAIDPAEALRKGLFAEEAQRDFKQAAQSYQSIIDAYGSQRRYAGTALFRLAEIHRKQGDKDSAAKLYQRVLTEFPDDETLVKLSRENLTGMGIAVASSGTTSGSAAIAPDEEEREIARITSLAKDSPDLINTPSSTEPPPLVKAASKGWLRVAEHALKSGARLTQRDKNGDSALHAATEAGHKAMVEWLIAKGADIKQEGTLGNTPLAIAFKHRRLEIFKLLLEKGASPNVSLTLEKSADSKSEKESNPLLGPALQQTGEWFELMLAHHADPNFRVGDLLPIHYLWSIRNKPQGLTVLTRLLEAGGRVEPRTGQRQCVLHEYAYDDRTNTPELMKLLLAHGGKELINTEDSGRTPLSIAVTRNNIALCKLLLDNGADPNLKLADGGITALHYAASGGNLAITKLLLDHKAAVDVPDNRGYNAIEKATLEDARRYDSGAPSSSEPVASPEMVNLLLDHSNIEDLQKRWLVASPSSQSVWARFYPAVLPVLLERVKYPRHAAQKTVFLGSIPYYLSMELAKADASSAGPASLTTLLSQGQFRDYLGSSHRGDYIPDLSCLTLVRRKASGPGFDRQMIDLEAISKTDDFQRIPALQWGDILELPLASDRPPPMEIVQRLQRGERRKVTVRVGDISRTFTMRGDRTTFDVSGTDLPLWTFRQLVGRLGLDPRLDRGRVRVLSKATGAETFVDFFPSPLRPVAVPNQPSPTAESKPGDGIDLADGDTVEIPLLVPGKDIKFASTVTLAVPGSLLPIGVNLRQPKFTLIEALAELLASDQCVLPHPDWSRLALVRWTADTKEWKRQPIDLATAMTTGKFDNILLQAGDILELPLKPDTKPETWTGFDDTTAKFFAQALNREVMISLTSGEFNRYSLTYAPRRWIIGKDGWQPVMREASTGNTLKVLHMGANAVLAALLAKPPAEPASAEVQVGSSLVSASALVLHPGDRAVVNLKTSPQAMQPSMLQPNAPLPPGGNRRRTLISPVPASP